MLLARKEAQLDSAFQSRSPTDNTWFADGVLPRGLGAVVIGGDCGALGVARSLGRAKVPVFFVRDSNPLAAYSRYTAHHSVWPGANAPDAAAWLVSLAHRHGLNGWVLFPAADAEVRLISQHHSELSSTFRLCTPQWETTRWAADKNLTYQRAAALDIDHPRTYEISDAADLITLDCQFPLVLKPAVKEGSNALTNSKVWQINDRDTLVRLFDDAVLMAGHGGLIVQELIPGDGSAQFSYAAVCRDGRPILSMTARRTRQHPTNFGTGTYVETVDNDRVESLAERFLESINYSGMVEMEFKLDSRDQSFRLIDVNPRVWTWNSLGCVAGVDFPLTMWRSALGENLPRMRARPGAAWMYFSRDFPEACKEMFAGTLSPIRYLQSFVKPTAFAAFAADDPLPAIVDGPLSLSRWIASRV